MLSIRLLDIAACLVLDEMFCSHGYAIAMRLKKERNIPYIAYATGGQLTAGTAEELSLSTFDMFIS